MLALIDADILVYRVGYASQKTVYRFAYVDGTFRDFEKGVTLSVAKDILKRLGTLEESGKFQKSVVPDTIENCLHSLKLMIQAILTEVGTDNYRMYLSSTGVETFRHRIATLKPYKGNRKQPRPIHYDAIREYLTKNHPCFLATHELEADDWLAIDQMKSDDSVIVTIDKDLDMIPGMHYNFVKKEKYTVVNPGHLMLSPNRRKLGGTGVKWFYAQMLLGDSADNIPGIPGYGPVKVYSSLKRLTTEKDLAKKVHMIYSHHYKDDGDKYFYEVADLLWIWRTEVDCKSEELREILI